MDAYDSSDDERTAASQRSPRSAGQKGTIRQGGVANGVRPGVAPPRRAGGLRSTEGSNGESDFAEWWVGARNAGITLTGSDEAEAPRCHLMNLKAGNAGSVAGNTGASSSESCTHPLLGEVLGGVPLRRHKRGPLIYKITSPSGKAYIGQTRWWAKRMAKHKSGKSNCTGLQATINKYGWDAMKKEVLWEGPEDELDAMEVRLIEEHDTLRNGYNLIPGGGFNPAKDPASLQKIRDGWATGDTRAKQKAGYTPKVRKKISKAQTARCSRDGNKQVREAGAKGCKKANLASQTPEAKAKARATRERTRELKAQGLLPKQRTGNLRANCANEQGEG